MEVKLRAYARLKLSFLLKKGLNRVLCSSKRVSCSTTGTATGFPIVFIGNTTGCHVSHLKAF